MGLCKGRVGIVEFDKCLMPQDWEDRAAWLKYIWEKTQLVPLFVEQDYAYDVEKWLCFHEKFPEIVRGSPLPKYSITLEHTNLGNLVDARIDIPS